MRAPASRRERLLVGAALAVAFALCALRFVELGADFPYPLTWSHSLYTDEGWYSTGAIRDHLRGQWFVPGDMNNGVAVPTFQLLQAVNFKLVGMSLAKARLPGVLLFFGLVGVAVAWLWRRDERMGAALAALLLAAHFHLFAYSRIALLELPMTCFVIAGFWLLTSPGRFDLARGAAAGVAVAAALLTKGSALYVLPALALAPWLAGGRRRRRIAGAVAGVAVPLVVFWATLLRRYPRDFTYYYTGVVERHSDSSPVPLAKNVWRALRDVVLIDPLLATATAVAVVALLVGWRRTIEDRLLVVLLVLDASYLGALFATRYRPTRYLLPLVVLSILLLGASVSRFRLDGRRLPAGLLAAAMVAAALLGGVRIGRYLADPQYSYRTMARDVGRRVADDAGDQAVLMGDSALQIALESGVWAVNGTSGTETLAWRLRHDHPTHYVSTGPPSDEIARTLAERLEVEEEASYDVLANYYEGTPVILYRLTPLAPSPTP